MNSTRVQNLSKLSTTLGSQRLLLTVVNTHPDLLRNSLEEAGAIAEGEMIEWVSPLAREGGAEYRDTAALKKLDILDRLSTPIAEFWPARGPVWDGLAKTSKGRPLLLEAKAHIPEMASPGTKASEESRLKIERSLEMVRRHYAPRASATWTGTFYQYANRLAFQFYLNELNGVDSRLVFLSFINAREMNGPTSVEEWHGATRLLHAVLGLPADLREFGVFHAFVDAREVGLEAAR